MTGLLTERLHQASENAVAMWTALARARGDRVLDRPGFTAIDGRRYRVMLRTGDPDAATTRELTELAREKRAEGRTVVVEDPFRVLDLRHVGMAAGQLPVMVREPAPAPEPAGVVRVRSADALAAAVDIVVGGFPLEEYQGDDADDVFPRSLLTEPGPAFFADPGRGACLTMEHGGVGGAYWVTTLPEHRSKGVGRALMHAVLRHFEDRPVTLTAARAGKPLYDKLGFTGLGDANWWR
ncbi:GNAT family N-acetyltransferase [Amycolatopsis solani]|uniref:GNAT family N-acetyltransferase n=1 Tax=Amycolatopsis solani TaxID=3028615 RepID=UPI0025B1338C|nr:GNAT family N-acetyltransferase [Amycolatopsis sp. MEP2-6]